MRVSQIASGEEWVETLKRGKTSVRITCCDCGFTHDLDIEVKDGKLIMRWSVNSRATAATRRKR